MIGKRIACAIFFTTLAEMNVLPKGIDKIVWTHDPKGSFNVKGFSSMVL